MSHETGGGGKGAAAELAANGVNLVESMFNWLYNWWMSLFESGHHH